jgi:hypothetical protein
MSVSPRCSPIFNIAEPIEHAAAAEPNPCWSFAGSAPTLNRASAKVVALGKFLFCQIRLVSCHDALYAAVKRGGQQ